MKNSVPAEKAPVDQAPDAASPVTGKASKPKAPRRTQAQRSSEMRNKLIVAATKVLASRGYLGFTTQEAAKVAKVTRGAPLHHFQTTDALLLAALERLFAKGRHDSEQAAARLLAAGPYSTDAILAALVDDARAFFFGPQFFIGIDALNSGNKNSRMRKSVRELADRYRSKVETMWRDVFVASGLSEEVADDIVWLTLTLVRGAAIRTTVPYEPARIERTIEIGMEMIRDRMHRLND